MCEGGFFNAKEFSLLGKQVTSRTLIYCAFKDILNAFLKIGTLFTMRPSTLIQLKLKIHKFCILPFYLIVWEATLTKHAGSLMTV